MKSTYTSAALVLALVAGHLVVDESLPLLREKHSRAAALVDGALHACRPAKRADCRPVDSRLWKSRAVLALPAVTTFGPPRTYEIVATRAPTSHHEPLVTPAAHARAPPLS